MPFLNLFAVHQDQLIMEQERQIADEVRLCLMHLYLLIIFMLMKLLLVSIFNYDFGKYLFQDVMTIARMF